MTHLRHRWTAPPDFHDRFTDALGEGYNSRDSGNLANGVPLVRPFAVRYHWSGGEGNSVASGPDRETALQAFAAANPHVTIIDDTEEEE